MSNLETEPTSRTPELPKLRPSPRVTIEVTEDLITNAVRADSTSCMIADAIKAQVPGATHVAVDLQSIRWSDPAKGLRYVYLTPTNAQGALVMFDQGLEMEAFTVKLRGAHVTRAHTATPDVPRVPRTGSRISPEQRAAKEQAKAERAAFLDERKARAEAEGRVGVDGRVMGDPIVNNAGPTSQVLEQGLSVPVRRGGRPQPVAALPAKVRVFGARSLKPPNVKAIGKPGSWVDPDASL